MRQIETGTRGIVGLYKSAEMYYICVHMDTTLVPESITLASNTSLYSTERAAAKIGISHMTLRTWAQRAGQQDIPLEARPVLMMNESVPCYTPGQIERLRHWHEERR